MSNLQVQLQKIAAEFVSSILSAMKSASLSDLAGQVGGATRTAVAAPKRRPGRPAKGLAFTATAPVAAAPKKPAKTGKRHRASAKEVQALKDTAMNAARALKPGFSKGEGPLELAQVTTLVLDAKGKALPIFGVPSTVRCDAVDEAIVAAREGDTCEGSADVEVQPLVRWWLRESPSPDLDSITVVIRGVKQNGAPLPLRFELVARE
jgi:hypothetical protein